MKQLLIKLISFFTTIRYEIGFIEAKDISSTNTVLSNEIHWLHYGLKNNNSWFADPFILSVDGDCVQVLAEEFFYIEKKGRISLLNIAKEGREYVLRNVTPLLSLASHLSFPYIIRENGFVYVCPENYQSGGVSIYEYDIKNSNLKFIRQIINDPLVDVQIFKHMDNYYAFGVLCKTGDLSETKELRIYRCNELLGSYQYVHSIFNEKKEERGAGTIWKEGDFYVRPAQCCEGGYGTMLIMYKIEIINGSIRESELYRYKPCPKSRFGLSLHTFNIYKELCVVDGHDYKNVPRLSRIMATLIDKALNRIKK